MKSSYMLKVQDAKAMDIQKTLQAAGIEVISIIEVYKDKTEEVQETKSPVADS
jgi:hypothetical protein